VLVHNAKPRSYLNDFQTERTKQARGVFGSEGEARNYAYQRLGKNPVNVGDNKIRSVDGTLQYRAKPCDINANYSHVHLETLDPKTGEVITNVHLYYPAKVNPPIKPQ
jgi:P pilus assembly protein, porin PapC